MQTWDAILSRRNVRQYSDKPIAREDLEKILEAGRRSPSAMNSQPWDFVVITSRDKLAELAKVSPYGKHVASSAATIALIWDKSQDANWAQFDLGQATMAMMIAATDLGIGTGHSGANDKALAAKLLQLPDGHETVGLIALGYPAQRELKPIRKPDRRPLNQVVHWDNW